MKIDNEIIHKMTLAKRRIYRFSDDLIHHVLFDELENKLFKKGYLSDFTTSFLHSFWENIANRRSYVIPIHKISSAEGFDLDLELNKRINFDENGKILPYAQKIVFLIGSPRSGTSFVYNLLAYHNIFAYFTNVSHHVWSLYNLTKYTRKFITDCTVEILNQDTKKIRLNGMLVLPSECENIFNRSIKVYDLLKGHEYCVHKPEVLDPELFLTNIGKHLLFFKRCNFLCKSPFNSFRIAQLQDICGTPYFVHIYRNGYCVSKSIKENNFKYHQSIENPTSLNGNQSFDNPWIYHLEHILQNKDTVNIFHLRYEDLIEKYFPTMEKLFEWLGIKISTIEYIPRYSSPNAELNYLRNAKIEKYSTLLKSL